jgi:hypothetical protein
VDKKQDRAIATCNAMMEQKNIDQLKATPLADVLSKCGARFAYARAAYSMYYAPYRDDHHPSLRVDVQKNVWYDFGTGEGGDVIDLVKKINNTDFAGAVQALGAAQFNVRAQLPESQPISPVASASGITIFHVQNLQNRALLNYIEERHVSLDIARQHCKELYYMAGPESKRFFGIGFRNDRGGWEIRNKYCKQATSKDVTTIRGDDSYCCVFEGFMDYLSYLTLQSVVQPSPANTHTQHSCIVLNSLVNLDKAVPFLQQHTHVHAYLDNDEAGRNATQRLCSILPNAVVYDYAHTYSKNKDYNEFLMSQPMPKMATSSQSVKMKM